MMATDVQPTGWRVLQAAGGALLALVLAGCGIWSSDKPKPAELPAVSALASAKVLWSARVGKAAVGFRPAYAADSVWAAAANGEVGRYDASTGKRLWSVRLDQPLVGGIGTDGTLAVVAARNGSLIALDADGKTRWSTPVGSEVVTVPVVGDGYVVVRASDNRVSAFDAETGKRRWVYQRQNPTLVLRQTSEPVMAGGAVIVGLPGGRLVSLSLSNGSLRWEAAVSQPRGSNEIERISDVVGRPVVEGRDVCAVSYQGRVACFDAATGRALWARDLSSSRGLDASSRQVVVASSDDVVQAYARSGGSAWRNDLYKLRGLSMPLFAGNRILIGDGNGMVHVLAADDGAVQARVNTDGSQVLSGPVSAGGVSVAQTVDGGLFAIRLE